MLLDYEFITRASDLDCVAREVLKAPLVGLDIEATDLDPRYGEIRLVQLIVPGEENGGRGRIFVLDLFETQGLGPVLSALRETEAIFIVHNAKFEQKWLWWKYRLRLWPVFCTFRASALIYNGKKGLKHDLDSVVTRELNEVPVNVGQGKSDWSGRLTQAQKDYAAEDVLRLFPLRVTLKRKLTEDGLLTAALIEFGVVFAEGRTELNGFPLDTAKWRALAKANGEERYRLREELLCDLPHPMNQIALPGMSCDWNVDSPKQVLASLRLLGLKSIDSTQEIVLAQFAKKYAPVRKLLEYRHVAQLVKTYGMKFLRHVEKDGRIHPDYYGLLVTGRYSANKSVQQIPRAPVFRACFRPKPGRRFVGADYSGIEMRLCAEISGDPVLTQVFLDGLDAHRATAAVIMEMALDEITSGQRQNAKPVNFGLIYGMMPEKLVLYAMANYGVTLSLTQARKYRQRYFERYKGIEFWHRRVLRDGQRQGFSRTLSGRIRYLNPHEAFNEYYNNPVQGSGADALKTSLAIVQDRIDNLFGISPAETPDAPVQLVHHVHDEILTEADDDHEMIRAVEIELSEGMKEGMEKFVKNVPVVVDPSNGYSWADVH